MNNGNIDVYCGTGHGKTTLAIGQSFHASLQKKSVIIIQFLKGRGKQYLDYLEELGTLNIRIFRFEKHGCCYDQLSEEEKQEEKNHILNGLHFARKVIATQECDLLILDEILGLLDSGIAEIDDIRQLLKMKDPEMSIILTGRSFPKELEPYVNNITTLTTQTID